jgi:peptide/nickel transport system permease protein
MAAYIASRLVGGILTVLIVMSLVFGLVRASGDPVALMADPYMTDEDIEVLRQDLGLDDPAPIQYVKYMGNLLAGDFGDSIRFRQPAFDLYLDRLPATLKLMGVATAISLLVGVPIGLAAGMRPGGFVDRFAKTFALVGQSIPSFWLGIMFIILFAVQLSLLPTSGDVGWKSLILPGVTMSTYAIAALVRVTRSSVLDVKDAEFVNVLWAKGLPPRLVVWKHILKNASLPILTLASLQIIGFLSGSVIVEQIFAWPGVGRLAVESVYSRDFPVIQTVVVVNTALLVTINFAVDFSYALIDPRVRLAGG